MRTADFAYHLPQERIAQKPAPDRTSSRLMVVHRSERRIDTALFTDLGRYLRPGDLLVLNDSRVFPARLHGRKAAAGGGGAIEALLLEADADGKWEALARPGKRLRPGTLIRFEAGVEALEAEVLEKNESGIIRIAFPAGSDPIGFAERHGEVPLPPYIERTKPWRNDRERYQTVYARVPGSVAAPTAGLHFTQPFLEEFRSKGVQTCEVTLHVGVGTFAPVKAERIEEHVMHEERFVVGDPAAAAIAAARLDGRRVIAVGTTVLRVLEGVAREHGGVVRAGAGRTRLFLYPPSPFHVVEALLTNFHLPCSTLLMLVSAFASPGRVEGREFVLEAYARAVGEGFRFYSYGDAMFLA